MKEHLSLNLRNRHKFINAITERTPGKSEVKKHEQVEIDIDLVLEKLGKEIVVKTSHRKSILDDLQA